jgi:enoyl-CoA hydratase/carnithine racemase
MSDRNSLAHFMHDVGLAAWFGGSLMGAVGLNGATADLDDPRQRARAANAGWNRWTPFNAVAIGMHVIGGAQLLRANKGRVAAQRGVLGNTGLKLGLTAGAMAATAYSRYLGRKIDAAGDVPISDATEPMAATPPEVATAQKQLKALQWAIPGLTGAVLASSTVHEEQQRPLQVAKGTLTKLPKLVGSVAS